jgi:hypothetical protein
MTIYESSDDRAVDLEPQDDEEPLCSEDEFAQEVRELVADEARRVFALVAEYGEQIDGQIAAWSVAFHDCVKVFGVDGGLRARLTSTEQVRWAVPSHDPPEHVAQGCSGECRRHRVELANVPMVRVRQAPLEETCLLR